MAHDTDESAMHSEPVYMPGVLGELGKTQFEAAFEIQKDFIGVIEESNLAWLARVQSEVALATELATKLAAARSIPDAAGACQECLSRQIEILAENGRQALTDGEKLMQAGARLLSNGTQALSS